MFGFAWSALILAAILLTDPAWAQGLPWPDPDSLRGQSGQPLDLASQSPFTLRDIGGPDASPTTVRATLFMPADASPTRPVPAVVLLHGSAGITDMRETTYARQFAAQGIAGTFIVKLVGSYTNVVGLPLYETMALLGGEGYPIRFGWLNAV